ncbi:helix-turn-helix domain-containing protein [Bordetella phage PY223]
MSEDQFLTPDELVSRYKGNISVKTLANWRTKGGGPEYIKIGGKIMYALSAVVMWERLRTYGSTAVRAANDARKAIASVCPLVFLLMA